MAGMVGRRVGAKGEDAHLQRLQRERSGRLHALLPLLDRPFDGGLHQFSHGGRRHPRRRCQKLCVREPRFDAGTPGRGRRGDLRVGGRARYAFANHAASSLERDTTVCVLGRARL